jgi:uncharacterized membrane protein YwaF
MFHKLITVAAWVLLAFIAYATISPIQDRPSLPMPSSCEHLAAFAVLGALFCLVYPRHIAFVCLIVFGSAVVLEIMQLLTPDRHGRKEMPNRRWSRWTGCCSAATRKSLTPTSRTTPGCD